MAAKRDMGAALKTSVKSETQAVKDRFEKADAVLGVKPTTAPAAAAPQPLKRATKARSKARRPDTPGEAEMAVRDTFSMPPGDYKLIEQLRSAAARAGHIYAKSEIVRAGLLVLSLLSPVELIKALDKVEHTKPGRKAG